MNNLPTARRAKIEARTKQLVDEELSQVFYLKVTRIQAKEVKKSLKRQLGTKKKALKNTSYEYEKERFTELQMDVIMITSLIQDIDLQIGKPQE